MNEKGFNQIIFTQSSSSSKIHKELWNHQTYNCLLEKKHTKVKKFIQQRKKPVFKENKVRVKKIKKEAKLLNKKTL